MCHRYRFWRRNLQKTVQSICQNEKKRKKMTVCHKKRYVVLIFFIPLQLDINID